jgi:hypothetical protein
MRLPILHIVVTRRGNEIVHTRSFVALENAESYFEWKSANLDPNDPKWPADSCELVIAQLTPIKEKGAVAAAPSVTVPRALRKRQDGDDDTFSRRR